MRGPWIPVNLSSEPFKKSRTILIASIFTAVVLVAGLVLLAAGTSIVRQHGGEGTQTGFSFDTETGASSNGGRQGVMEAQRFPEDFDGVVANAPWLDQTGFTIGAIWNQRALDEAPVTAAKMALVAEKVIAKCDEIDGVKDRLKLIPVNIISKQIYFLITIEH